MTEISFDRAVFKGIVTHRYRLGDIEDDCRLFGNQRDGVPKVARTS